MRGRGHAPFRRQVRQVSLDVHLAHVRCMAQTVKTDEGPAPVDIGALRLQALMHEADALAQPVEQPGCLQWLQSSDVAGRNRALAGCDGGTRHGRPLLATSRGLSSKLVTTAYFGGKFNTGKASK